MKRLIAIPLTLGVLAGAVVLLAPSAFAQAPGQIPGTMPPAYVPPPPLPPPVAPMRVPSAVTPLPNPTYGVPRGVTSPTYSGVTPSYSSVYTPSKKRPGKKKRRPRVTQY